MKYRKTHKQRRKSRKQRRNTRRRLYGGAMTPIESKPIVIIFFHGGIQLSQEGLECDFKDGYTLKKNVQYMHTIHPGEVVMADERSLSKFFNDPSIRKTTFEPLFDIHSISDLNEKNAIYKNICRFYENTTKLSKANLNKRERDPIEKPFTNDGESSFEHNLRAREGSIIPDTRLSIHDTSEMKYKAMYIHYPNGTVKTVNLNEIFEELNMPFEAKATVYKYNNSSFKPTIVTPGIDAIIKLSQIFEYLEKTGVYKPDVGIGLIQFSCNMFETNNTISKETYLKNASVRKACSSVRNIWHIANTEYKTLDLLDSDEIEKKYKLPIVIPVDPVYYPLETIGYYENSMNIENWG